MDVAGRSLLGERPEPVTAQVMRFPDRWRPRTDRPNVRHLAGRHLTRKAKL